MQPLCPGTKLLCHIGRLVRLVLTIASAARRSFLQHPEVRQERLTLAATTRTRRSRDSVGSVVGVTGGGTRWQRWRWAPAVEQMPHREHRMPRHHPRTGVAHDHAHLFTRRRARSSGPCSSRTSAWCRRTRSGRACGSRNREVRRISRKVRSRFRAGRGNGFRTSPSTSRARARGADDASRRGRAATRRPVADRTEWCSWRPIVRGEAIATHDFGQEARGACGQALGRGASTPSFSAHGASAGMIVG